MATSEEEEEAARATFASLPHTLALNVFARLPADARARAACVCTAWRTTINDVSLWTRLDLSPASGVTCTVNIMALCAAAVRARGGLTALDVSGCRALVGGNSTALLIVVAVNAGALRELRVCEPADDTFKWRGALQLEAAEALLRAAPLLHVCELSITCNARAAPRLLRREPPFGVVCALGLRVEFYTARPEDNFLSARHAALAAVLAALAAEDDDTACQSLRFLHFLHAPLHTPADLDAVVGAALARQLPGLGLYACGLDSESAPALVRLLGSNALQTLHISHESLNSLDRPAAAVLATALRANDTLTSLTLCHCSLFHDAAVAATLLGALTAHPSLRKLNISYNYLSRSHAEVGALLGALVAANAPALRELNVSGCLLGAYGLGPLVDALPANTHLHTLHCSDNDVSGAFVRDRLLPALRANTSLRSLPAFIDEESDAAHQAVALVESRGALADEAHGGAAA
jgi:hypothetical protein